MGRTMIEDYSFGRLCLAGKVYTSDVIIYPDRVDEGWRRAEGHRLAAEDVRNPVAAKPEIIIVGTGACGKLEVPDKIQEHLAELGIELKVAKTDRACRLYNELAPHRRVVAALHLTC